MRRNWVIWGLKLALFAAIGVAVLGLVVMGLWNWLAPDLFGGHLISFWQAIGLLALSKLLFGGLRGPWGQRMHWRQRMMARWEHMTAEEREKFRNGMRQGCGRSGSTVAE